MKTSTSRQCKHSCVWCFHRARNLYSAKIEPHRHMNFLVTPRGFEPLLPPWKGGVLTAWPWSLISSLFTSLYNKNSPSRARTYNPSVNSRVLYHWAIEDYSFSLRWNCYSFWSYTQNHTLKSFIRRDNSSFLPSWISPRPISISQLHVLPHFHLWPINLVVFKGS